MTKDCLLVLAAFSRHQDAIDWARSRVEQVWGPVVLVSPCFDFEFTDFYTGAMGSGLKKVLWAFERLVKPNCLVEYKLRSNGWEAECAASSRFKEARPLNLDPGYVTEAKLVLATTKDRDHRIYLDRGIFAEVTLSYRHGGWQNHPWTYPDFQRPEYHQFFLRCREYLRSRYRGEPDVAR